MKVFFVTKQGQEFLLITIKENCIAFIPTDHICSQTDIAHVKHISMFSCHAVNSQIFFFSLLSHSKGNTSIKLNYLFIYSIYSSIQLFWCHVLCFPVIWLISQHQAKKQKTRSVKERTPCWMDRTRKRVQSKVQFFCVSSLKVKKPSPSYTLQAFKTPCLKGSVALLFISTLPGK